MLDWKSTLQELQAFAHRDIHLGNLSHLSIDTLYGSMYGLNHRYMLLSSALSKDFDNMMAYSIQRIKHLIALPQVTYRHQVIPKNRQMGFGTYGWKYNPELIKLAVQKGLLIDTAEGYGFGRVETRLGQILDWEQHPQVNTKVSRSHMSSKAIIAAAKRSRQKLGVIPHYQTHFPHAAHSDEEVGTSLVSLRRSDIIQSIGLGNCSIDMIESMQAFLSDYSGDVIHSIQVEYNLGNRRIEKTLLPYCQERGIAIIVYSPLGQKFNKLWRPVLDNAAKRYECTAAQVALAWVLRHKGVVPIPRTNNMEHLMENIDAMSIKLGEGTIAELNRIYPYRRLHGLL